MEELVQQLKSILVRIQEADPLITVYQNDGIHGLVIGYPESLTRTFRPCDLDHGGDWI